MNPAEVEKRFGDLADRFEFVDAGEVVYARPLDFLGKDFGACREIALELGGEWEELETGIKVFVIPLFPTVKPASREELNEMQSAYTQKEPLYKPMVFPDLLNSSDKIPPHPLDTPLPTDLPKDLPKAKVLTVSDISIKSEYEYLLPKQSEEEYARLRESIRNDGLWHKITINQDGVILDGHNRWRACREVNYALTMDRFEVKSFSDPLLEKKFVIESNLNRRHLNDAQKTQLGIPLLEIEEELAKRRQGWRKETSSSNELKVKDGFREPSVLSVGQARDIVAEKIGVKPTTFERAKTVLEEGPLELRERMLSGETSISSAYNEVRQPVKSETVQSEHCPVCGHTVTQGFNAKLSEDKPSLVEAIERCRPVLIG